MNSKENFDLNQKDDEELFRLNSELDAKNKAILERLVL